MVSTTTFALRLAAAMLVSDPPPDQSALALTPQISQRCEVWLSTPSRGLFAELARRVRDELAPMRSIILREWTTTSQPGAGAWWIRVAETRGQWQIAYLGPDGKVELEPLPVLDASTQEVDIAGEIALVALSSCSTGLDRSATITAPSSSPSTTSRSAAAEPRSRRSAALLGASIGLGTLGLVSTAVGFGLSFHYYRGFKTDVDECTFDTFSGGGDMLDIGDVYQNCRIKHERALRTHWYMSGIGTAGTLALGSGLVLTIPATIELRYGRRSKAELSLRGWINSSGAGLGINGRF